MQTVGTKAISAGPIGATRLLLLVAAGGELAFVDAELWLAVQAETGAPPPSSIHALIERYPALADAWAVARLGESRAWTGSIAGRTFSLTSQPLFDGEGRLAQVVVRGAPLREADARAAPPPSAGPDGVSARGVLPPDAYASPALTGVLDSVDEPVWSVDREYRLMFHNRFFAEIFYVAFGIRPAPGQSLIDRLPGMGLAHIHDYWVNIYSRVLAGEIISTQQEYPVAGRRRVFAVTLYPIRDGARGGEVVGVACYSKDISDSSAKTSFEEALRHSEERFTRIFRSSPVAHCIVSADDGVLLDINESFGNLVGGTRAALLGQAKTLTHLFRGKSPQGQTVRELMDQSAHERRALRDVPLELSTFGGESRQVELTLAPVELESGPGLLGLLHDVTERSRFEQQLRQAQKMEAIGRLAGGVAHDFNNIMTVILGYSQLLEAEAVPGSLERRGLEKITRSATKAASLTEQLLAFGRKQVLEPRVLDLAELVNELQTLVQRAIGEDVEVTMLVDPRAGRVRADKVQMQQVLLNLAVNAREAMPGGGKLTISLDSVEVGAELARQKLGLHRGRYALLQVSDTGVGMDRETQAHIFEPFFTTKEIGQGSGLGLATVYGIVTQTGGHILVESQVGRGTTFRIFLPKVEETDAPLVSAEREPAGPAGHETVLLVEDETDVRELVGLVLEQHGYRVLPASGGSEALRLLAGHDGRVDLLLTDVVMPEMNGRQVAERVLSLRPGTRVLFMSGYPGQAITTQGILEPGTALLRKPFTAETLATRIRDLLDQAA
jgi:PAS domain S-box-containing protein